MEVKEHLEEGTDTLLSLYFQPGGGAAAEGTTGLMLALMYGTGLRLMECVRLRVKDVDFERAAVTVREGKGGKDRQVMLPQSLKAHLLEAGTDICRCGAAAPRALRAAQRLAVSGRPLAAFGCTVQDLLGHKSVETTQIYTHVMEGGGVGTRSPLDGL